MDTTAFRAACAVFETSLVTGDRATRGVAKRALLTEIDRLAGRSRFSSTLVAETALAVLEGATAPLTVTEIAARVSHRLGRAVCRSWIYSVVERLRDTGELELVGERRIGGRERKRRGPRPYGALYSLQNKNGATMDAVRRTG